MGALRAHAFRDGARLGGLGHCNPRCGLIVASRPFGGSIQSKTHYPDLADLQRPRFGGTCLCLVETSFHSRHWRVTRGKSRSLGDSLNLRAAPSRLSLRLSFYSADLSASFY